MFSVGHLQDHYHLGQVVLHPTHSIIRRKTACAKPPRLNFFMPELSTQPVSLKLVDPNSFQVKKEKKPSEVDEENQFSKISDISEVKKALTKITLKL